MKLKSLTFFPTVLRLCKTGTRFYHFRTAPVDIKWLIVERLVCLLIPFCYTSIYLETPNFLQRRWTVQRRRNYSGGGLCSGGNSGEGLCSCHTISKTRAVTMEARRRRTSTHETNQKHHRSSHRDLQKWHLFELPM